MTLAFDLILMAVIVVLLVERIMAENRHARERKTLTNAVLARHAGDFAALEREPRPPRDLNDHPGVMEGM